MGMCNLTWPKADEMLANESLINNIPNCVSMASSTSLERMFELSKGKSWIQLYNFNENFVMEILERAHQTGYKVAILTVDVPIQFRRAKDDKKWFYSTLQYWTKTNFRFRHTPTLVFKHLVIWDPKTYEL